MPAPLNVDKEAVPARVGALDNPRWEKFCEHIINGATQVLAYQLAFGGDINGAGSLASRLMDNPKIQGRLGSLRKLTGVGNSVLSLAEKRAGLAAAWRTPIADVDEKHPLAQSVKRTKDKDGNETVTIEMVNKLKALELDAKLAGELNGSPQSLRISMFAPGQAIEVEAQFVADEKPDSHS